LHLRVQR